MFKYKLYRGEHHSRDKQEETKKLMNLIIVFLVLVVLWALFHVLRSNSGYRRSAKLAPGPYPFPIIGNILQMGRIPHLTLAKLSKTYGPLMSLHLGSMYSVVVTSPEMAKEILQKNDIVFSSRTIQSAAQVHDHHNKSMAFLPVGSQWNKIRRICREQLFSIQCLEASQGLRQEKLRQLCDYVQECCHSGQVVDIGKVVFTTTLNLMSVTLFSVDFSNYGRSDSINEWEQAIKGVMNVIGVPNFADFFPVLKLVDPQGLKRQADFYFEKLLGMFEDLINQRLESRITSPKKKDLLEILLDSSQESEYHNLSCLDIKHLLLFNFTNFLTLTFPLMSVHLGSMYTVVVTSPEMAKEILQKNDIVFSSRTIQSAAQVHDHHNKSMAFLPVGSQWNKIRRICREQLFSIQCLEASQGFRQEKLRQLCDYVQECCHSGQVVDIGKVVFTTTLNLMSVTLFSVDFSNYGRSDSINEWEQAIKGVMNVIGVPNFSDFFPVLKLVDPQGLKRQADFYFGKLLGMFEDLINQRLESRITSPKKKDLLEILLDSSQESEYHNLSCLDIKHLLLDLTVGGSDTTATTIEWTMTELLRNPNIMAIAKDELKTVLGGNKQAKESDILKLPYLQAIIDIGEKFGLALHRAPPLKALPIKR
ncbi:hypothetical protein RD792_005448 [Penstemon davidsonii]|uniref:Cytochrome P450 n=1 Tax=Penstemon davidsonii TaxID=160366 RepID=A0ABR0DL12_9LAMI|nr:hypothetical protein RD792_005448 [Penstemon davidsonii]